jgi:hypothetical protein
MNVYLAGLGIMLLYLSFTEQTIEGLTINDKSDTEAMGLLIKMNDKTERLFKYIRKNKLHVKDERCKRLLERFSCKKGTKFECKLSERDEQYGFVAYSKDKGAGGIGLCLRDKNKNLVNENTLTFVYLHELAHVMSKKWDHGDEFWNNFSDIIEIAIKAKIYKYQNFNSNNVTFCGEKITSSPYNPANK